MATKKFKTMDEYFKTIPPDAQLILERIRQMVRRAVPEAVETISYQMPAFKLNGKNLVYFAAWKKYIGLYPPPPKAFKKETGQFAGPKGNLQLPIDKFPMDLVERIVKHRAKEILGKAKK